MKEISVIIPCYNAQHTIDRCMKSIEAQTIGWERLEVILVNDASTDGTLDKLREWERKYPGSVSVLTYDENIRQGGARNVGIRHASSAYIAFVDADDWVEPDMFQVLYEKMQDKQCDIVRGKFLRHRADGSFDERLTDQVGQDQEYHFRKIGGYYFSEYESVGNIGEFGLVIPAIYRRDLIVRHACFFPEKLAYEDNYWASVLSLYAGSCYIVDRICYHYMTNVESTVMKKDVAHHLDRLTIEEKKLEYYQSMGLLRYPEFYEKIQSEFVLLYFLNTLFVLADRCGGVSAELLNHMILTVKEKFPDWEHGRFMNGMNESQRYLLGLLKTDREYTQQQTDEHIGRYLRYRPYSNGIPGVCVSRIRSLWSVHSSEITLEEQAYFYKLKECFLDGQCDGEWLAYEIKTLLDADIFERKVYAYTFLINVLGDGRFAMELIQMLMQEEHLSMQSTYFLFGQIKSTQFLGRIPKSLSINTALYRLLQKTAQEFWNALREKSARIPVEERNPKLALVVTEQFLTLAHGPTKSALARCAALKRNGMQVLLVNTVEHMTNVGAISGFEFAYGNYRPEISTWEQVEWQGMNIPFFQCDRNMPDVEVLESLLGMVRKIKPYFAVAIGGDGMFASLLRELIPVLAVGMVPSELGISLADYQTLGRAFTQNDLEYLQKIGKTQSQVIVHKFTSDLREQKIVLTRSGIGLGEGFVIAVVGARLEEELTDAFWEMAERVLAEEDAMILLLGNYRQEKTVFRNHPSLKGKVRSEGHVEEVLAYLELCNIYVNPIRTGGGTSCVEAMAKGLPVVTAAEGDVALHAGKAFHVKDYREMQQVILRYMRDQDFYEKQSLLAKERAAMLMDTDRAFWEAVCTFMRREGLELR